MPTKSDRSFSFDSTVDERWGKKGCHISHVISQHYIIANCNLESVLLKANKIGVGILSYCSWKRIHSLRKTWPTFFVISHKINHKQASSTASCEKLTAIILTNISLKVDKRSFLLYFETSSKSCTVIFSFLLWVFSMLLLNISGAYWKILCSKISKFHNKMISCTGKESFTNNHRGVYWFSFWGDCNFPLSHWKHNWRLTFLSKFWDEHIIKYTQES